MRPLTDRNRRVISFSQFLFTTKKVKHHHSLSRSTDRIILLMFALAHYYYYYHFLFLFFIKMKYIVIDYLSSTSYLLKKNLVQWIQEIAVENENVCFCHVSVLEKRRTIL